MKWLWLLFAVWLATAQAGMLQSRGFFLDENINKHGGRTIKYFTGNKTISVGVLGRHLSLDDEDVTFKWKSMRDGRGLGFTVESESSPGIEFEDCYEHSPDSPISNKMLLSIGDYNANVPERYWLSSTASFHYVYPEVPLFTSHNSSDSYYLCLTAKVEAPYSTKRTRNILKYAFWIFDDPKEAHKYAVKTFLGKPSGLPDQRRIQYPVWSTWAKYSRLYSSTDLWAFAKKIKDSGFQNAQIQIDDRWESCYGSLAVDEIKLRNFRTAVREIKVLLGFNVSLWVHPFINKDCEPWYTEALTKGYLVLNEEGGPDTTWWNSNSSGAGYIDFTNPEAAEWFARRLQNLANAYDIDAFTFEIGESHWTPQIPVQTGNIELHPSNIVSSYVRTVARFGSAIEVHSGMRTQDLPIFTRMAAKDSSWDNSHGLSTLIPSLLQMNLNGYTLVSPGPVGGNGKFLSKELFIRWLQANVFMPTLQFSFVPWDHDLETVEICRRYTELHASFTSDIIAAMEASVRDGTPVNPPVWWVDSTDEEAFPITDEYLLGSDILVAPVLTPHTTARDIYLPKGTWYESGDPSKPHKGPIWLRNFPAPLDVLPYFVKNLY